MKISPRGNSKLELALRNAELRKIFYLFVNELSLTTIVNIEIMEGSFPESMALSKNELANMAAHATLSMFTVETAFSIRFECDNEGVGTKLVA